jgi:Leucine Rich repeats (2 copies)
LLLCVRYQEHTALNSFYDTPDAARMGYQGRSPLLVRQLPRELERLTSLQSLDISYCEQLADLKPLAKLSALQSLNFSFCGQLSDLSPLAKLTSPNAQPLQMSAAQRRLEAAGQAADAS